MKSLVLYTRDGCHLCEDMLAHLRELQLCHSFDLTILDVDTEDHWFTQYNDKVPILFLDDEEICRYFLDQASLLQALE